MAATLLSDVAANVLADVVLETGRRIGTAVVSYRGRGYRDEVELVRWLDTYQIVGDPPGLPAVPDPVTADQLAEVLQRDEFHGVLHELLAARLTGAPETDVRQVRLAMELTLGRALPGTAAAGLADALFDYYDD